METLGRWLDLEGVGNGAEGPPLLVFVATAEVHDPELTFNAERQGHKRRVTFHGDAAGRP